MHADRRDVLGGGSLPSAVQSSRRELRASCRAPRVGNGQTEAASHRQTVLFCLFGYYRDRKKESGWASEGGIWHGLAGYGPSQVCNYVSPYACGADRV